MAILCQQPCQGPELVRLTGQRLNLSAPTAWLADVRRANGQLVTFRVAPADKLSGLPAAAWGSYLTGVRVLAGGGRRPTETTGTTPVSRG